MRGYSLLTRYPVPPAPVTFHVELWEQALWRRGLAAFYHWYDMRIFKVPGFKVVEDLLLRWQMRDGDLKIPLSAKQDIRCYHLTHAGRRTLASLEVDGGTYRRLAGSLD